MDLQVLHDELHAKIDEIDARLDSQVNQKTAGKRAIVNGLIEDAKVSWEPVGTQLVEQLKTADLDVQIGIYYGLLRMLNAEFNKPLAEAVEEKAKDIPEAPADVIPEEELKSLSTARSELYGKVKQLVEMNETFGGGANMRMPKRRTGGRGPRGPRAITAFNWEIEGKEFDKLKDVAEEYDQYEKTADLTKAMRDAKIDLKNPEDRIEFTLPDGKLLVGTRDPDKVATEDADVEEEEEEEVTPESE